MFNQWCTIESDPGVFTQLVQKIGAPSVQVEQIYSMEDDQLINRLQPDIYGFIFLFKWQKSLQTREHLTIYDNDLFFARQIINNACATQAIISVLLNAPIQIKGDLKDFYEFTKELPSEDKGLALSNSQAIRKIHNSFSRPQPFIFKQDKKKKTKQGDVYHFVSYIPHKNQLYELDGLQPGPILLGQYEKPKDWIQIAKKQIQNRIMKYSQKQIRFNLLVVCQDLRGKVIIIQISDSKINRKLKNIKIPDKQKIKIHECSFQLSSNIIVSKCNRILRIKNSRITSYKTKLNIDVNIVKIGILPSSRLVSINPKTIKYSKKTQLRTFNYTNAQNISKKRQIGITFKQCHEEKIVKLKITNKIKQIGGNSPQQLRYLQQYIIFENQKSIQHLTQQQFLQFIIDSDHLCISEIQNVFQFEDEVLQIAKVRKKENFIF